MDISCPQCQTLYEIDEARLGQTRITLQCSDCGHQFGVEPGRGPQDERQRRWMVERQESGDVLYCRDFKQLHEWLMSQEVGPDDRISRSGERWTKLGDIGELTPIFKAVESIAEFSANQAGDEGSATRPQRPRVDSTEGAAQRREVRPRAQTNKQWSAAEVGGDGEASDGEAAKAQSAPRQVRLEGQRFGEGEANSGGGEAEDEGRERELTLGEQELRPGGFDESEGRSPWRWVAMVLVLAALIGGGWWGYDMVMEGADEDGIARAGQEDAQGGEAAIGEAVDAVAHAGQAAAVAGVTSEGRARLDEARRGAGQAAEEAAERAAAEAAPASLGELLARAERSRDRGDIAQALERYEAVFERSPQHPEAMIGVGWTHLRGGQMSTAIEAFEEAYASHPDRGEALIGVGRAHRDAGNYGEALEAYERYLERHPGGAERSIAEFQSQEMRRRMEAGE